MAYFRFFRVEFQKIIVTFEISTLKFPWYKYFGKKQKCQDMGVFFGQIFKKLLSYLKSGPSSLIYCKTSWKKNLPNFDAKNALFVYFWARFLKSYCHILNSAPSNLYIWNFLQKNKKKKHKIWNKKKKKSSNLGSKMPYLCVFGLIF